MKVSLLFRISRFIRFVLMGLGRKETEHYLFTLSEPMSDIELYSALAACGWQPNYVGYVYKGEIYQCRRLVHRGRHQYHVRCYQDGRLTGHFEVAPEYDTAEHLAGVDLRTMNGEEAQRLTDDVSGVTVLRRKQRRKHDGKPIR
jgi:hypothetical protein